MKPEKVATWRQAISQKCIRTQEIQNKARNGFDVYLKQHLSENV